MVLLTREQLEERLAALHRASLELVGDLSLETLLKRIVKLAREQVDAAYAALGVVDDDGKLIEFIPIGMTKAEIKAIGNPPAGLGLIGAIGKEKRTIRLANMQNDPRSYGFPCNHPAMESFLGVPIMLADRLLGQLYLTNKVGAPEFTIDDERVIETLAAYAAVAINNARLYEALLIRDEALSQRNEDQALINDFATALSGSLDVDEILELTINRAVAYLGVEGGEIYLREDSVNELHLALHRGNISPSFFNQERFQIGEGLIGKVADLGKPLVCDTTCEDIPELREIVSGAGLRLIAVVPMTTGGNIVGIMAFASSKSHHFTERQLQMLSAIGSWAAITIENAHLHRQARRLAVLEERERIGMDLHDGIIQSIYAVGLALDYARVSLDDDPDEAQQKIEQAIDGLNKTIRDIRAYILDLRPRQFVGKDLMHGLQSLVDEYRTNTLADATLVGPEDKLVGLPASHATALFHICQEALANVAKHSRARRTDIHLWTTRDRVLLEIADNGQGFDIRKMSVTLGHGLSNMHVRARKVGGDVEITSAPGEGTTVLAWVPRRA
ncbi:MAG: GAF domain-containing sensor histidine kinase [Chloroflexi bacterium]|nr:GAF domain-containing sensor histidine kinase [Chloroflexota bacterium]